jgi:uncharacterized HAD superfamily protein
MYGTDMTRDRITDYMMEKVWNMPMEDIFPRIETFYKSSDHDMVLPVDGSIDAIKRLSQKHELIIVTSRPDFVKEGTLGWLEKHFGNLIKEVHFTNQFMGNGGVKTTKADVCKRVGIEVLIEDAPVYAKNVSKEGIPVLLIDTPWNKDVSGDLITRVYSWDEIVSILL